MTTNNIVTSVLLVIILSMLLIANGYSSTPIPYSKNSFLYKKQFKDKCFIGDFDSTIYYYYFSSVSDSTQGYYWSNNSSTIKRLRTSLIDDTTIQVILLDDSNAKWGVLLGSLSKLNDLDAAILDADSIGFYCNVTLPGESYDSIALRGFLYQPALNKTIKSELFGATYQKGKIFSLLDYPVISGPSTDWGDMNLNQELNKYFSRFQDSFVSFTYSITSDSR